MTRRLALTTAAAAVLTATTPAHATGVYYCHEYSNEEFSLTGHRSNTTTIALELGTPLKGRVDVIAADVGVVTSVTLPHSSVFPQPEYRIVYVAASGGHYWSARQVSADTTVWDSSLGYGNHCGTPKVLIS